MHISAYMQWCFLLLLETLKTPPKKRT